MCLEQFFGDLSPFQIIVSAVAFLTGGYTCYKSFFERANISLYIGDAVRIVVMPDGRSSTIHLMCNLVNKSVKVGTVHRIEAHLSGPQNSHYKFVWSFFYKYSEGAEKVEKISDIYPVAVSQKDSTLLLVGFEAEAVQSCQWLEGTYEFKVVGWVNRKDHTQSSNFETIFNIQITQDKLRKLGELKPASPIYITIPVKEWERQHR